MKKIRFYKYLIIFILTLIFPISAMGIIYPDGTFLVNENGPSDMFMIENGYKRWIKTPCVIENNWDRWVEKAGKVIKVSKTVLDQYPTGLPIEAGITWSDLKISDGTLIRIVSDTQTYIVKDGKLSYISPEVFEAYGYKRSDVIDDPCYDGAPSYGTEIPMPIIDKNISHQSNQYETQSQQNNSDTNTNQSMILKATVRLICPVNEEMASQGSGTIIDSNGIILTNNHVIEGTVGCLVGFIDDFNDEPFFNERQIADIIKVSANNDIAILKIRNPQNNIIPNIKIKNDFNDLQLGDKISIYGYPSKFGSKITYSSGDFSGIDDNYIKTTAILEHGNSGGGAYSENGSFVGIPTAVIKGELNAMSYILSANVINAWLNDTNLISDSVVNNNYSRVSILESIDLSKLDSLAVFESNKNNKASASTNTTNVDQQNIKETSQSATNLSKNTSYNLKFISYEQLLFIIIIIGVGFFYYKKTIHK